LLYFEIKRYTSIISKWSDFNSSDRIVSLMSELVGLLRSPCACHGYDPPSIIKYLKEAAGEEEEAHFKEAGWHSHELGCDEEGQ